MEKQGKIEVIKLVYEAFLIMNGNQQTRHWVLEGGPWFNAQKPLMLRKWELRPIREVNDIKNSSLD